MRELGLRCWACARGGGGRGYKLVGLRNFDEGGMARAGRRERKGLGILTAAMWNLKGGEEVKRLCSGSA